MLLVRIELICSLTHANPFTLIRGTIAFGIKNLFLPICFVIGPGHGPGAWVITLAIKLCCLSMLFYWIYNEQYG